MESKKVESNAELTPFEKEFKVQLNLPAAYFSVFYAIYVVYMIVSGNFSDLPAVVVLGVIAIGYLFGYRPYKYVVKRRTLEIHRRIGKTKEINLMNCETITDPIAKMTKIMHIHMKSIWMMELVKQLLQKIKWDLWMLLFIQIREFTVKLKNITKLIVNGKRKEEKKKRKLKELLLNSTQLFFCIK